MNARMVFNELVKAAQSDKDYYIFGKPSQVGIIEDFLSYFGLDYEIVSHYFLDRDAHNKNIVEKMLDEINSCKFLVADLTLQNPGVYYEAGYAKALGKTVIFTCHKNDFDTENR